MQAVESVSQAAGKQFCLSRIPGEDPGLNIPEKLLFYLPETADKLFVREINSPLSH